jgi:hypothetical protein
MAVPHQKVCLEIGDGIFPTPARAVFVMDLKYAQWTRHFMEAAT